MSAQFEFQQGRVNFIAQYLWAGEDLLLLITGGDKPHIGATVVAEANAVLQTTSYVGHKEAELAEPMALYLAERLRCKVVLSAGLHWDDFNQQLLDEIKNAWQEFARRLFEQIQRNQS